MSRITELIAVTEITRHCTDPQCSKCRARSRWYRRKARDSKKTPVLKKTRKEVMPL